MSQHEAQKKKCFINHLKEKVGVSVLVFQQHRNKWIYHMPVLSILDPHIPRDLLVTLGSLQAQFCCSLLTMQNWS